MTRPKDEEVKFTAISTVLYERDHHPTVPHVVDSEIKLGIEGLETDFYIDEFGLPRKRTLQTLSHAFVVGILTNIRRGHDKGWMVDHKHLEWVIKELTEGFATPTGKTEE